MLVLWWECQELVIESLIGNTVLQTLSQCCFGEPICHLLERSNPTSPSLFSCFCTFYRAKHWPGSAGPAPAPGTLGCPKGLVPVQDLLCQVEPGGWKWILLGFLRCQGEPQQGRACGDGSEVCCSLLVPAAPREPGKSLALHTGVVQSSINCL